MASNVTDVATDESLDFLAGLSEEELNALLSALNEDEEDIKEEKTFQCNHCPKLCISQRGLTRHITCKHPEVAPARKKQQLEDVLSHQIFEKILLQSIVKLSEELFYPEEIITQFKHYQCTNSIMDKVYHLIEDVVLKFKAKGDAEKFYPEFYDIFQNGDVFDGLSHHCNVLLGYEFANGILSFLINKRIVNHALSFELLEKTDFSAKDKEVLSYLSGYIVSTLYRRIRFSKKSKGNYQQQCLSILTACKLVDGMETDTSRHKLIITKDRGGLWKATVDTFNIFCIAESYFLSATKEFVTKIDAKHIVSRLLKDTYVLIYFNSIRRSCEDEVEKEVAFNLLEDMLTLFIRLRAHSYAQDKQQHHKIAKDVSKSRSLRTDLKKKSSDLDCGH